jgi:hypothetical protein
MTICEIKRRTAKTSPYFFSHDTMKFFRQTLRSFHVTKQGEKYLIQAPVKDFEGKFMGYTERLFNPKTNELEMVRGE